MVEDTSRTLNEYSLISLKVGSHLQNPYYLQILINADTLNSKPST